MAEVGDGWKHAKSQTHTHTHAHTLSLYAVSDLPLFLATVSMCFSISIHPAHTCTHMFTQSHILVRVVDIELLQKQAIIEEAIVHLGQELEDDAFLRSQVDYSVVPVGARFVVHNDACQTVPGERNTELKLLFVSCTFVK